MTKSLLCCWMLRIQYLSNDHWYVWITASCLVTSLHANVSLLLGADSSFPFDMQMFWLDEFGSFSVALKPLHYRGRICGMSSSRGFQIQQKSVIRGCCGRVRKWVRMASLQQSQLFPPEWRNPERDCGFALTPLDWNPWADIELHKQFSSLTSQAL